MALGLAALLGGVGGCGSAVSEGYSTALDGADLQRITDDIAMKIAADPDVRAAVAREGPLPVVVLPVENRLTGEVLPRGPAMAFTARVRNLLSASAPRDYVWVLNRDEFYALRGRELDRSQGLGPAPESIQPRYALHARFQSLTNDNKDLRSVYYLCVYSLTDITDRTTLWTGSYELKKSAVKNFLD